MNDESRDRLAEYYSASESWVQEGDRTARRLSRFAFIIASVAAAIALLEAIALVIIMPLKTVEPYTLMVDKQTGYVQALKPMTPEAITSDAALTRSFLVQYVIAREEFDIDILQSNFRKVGLWSTGEARERYLAETQASNPASPLATLPRRALIEVQVRSVASINADTALVRFATVRTDPGAPTRQEPQLWSAVIKYRYSDAPMSAEDRYTNPLGFQVVRYRRAAETLPVASGVAADTPALAPAATTGPALVPAPQARPTATGAR